MSPPITPRSWPISKKKYDAWWDSLPLLLVNEDLPENKAGAFPLQKLRDTQGEPPLWEPDTRKNNLQPAE